MTFEYLGLFLIPILFLIVWIGWFINKLNSNSEC